MLGLSEREEVVEETLADLLQAGCKLLTMGQYLQPTTDHLPVSRFLPPAEFDFWQKRAIKMGFKSAACGPMVRSSYRAATLI